MIGHDNLLCILRVGSWLWLDKLMSQCQEGGNAEGVPQRQSYQAYLEIQNPAGGLIWKVKLTERNPQIPFYCCFSTFFFLSSKFFLFLHWLEYILRWFFFSEGMWMVFFSVGVDPKDVFLLPSHKKIVQ